MHVNGQTALRGRSLLPLLHGDQPEEWPEAFFAEYSMINYATAHRRCVRTPEWKLIRDFHNDSCDELYHLSDDPVELKNSITDPTPEIQAVVERLSRMLDAHMAEINVPQLAPR